MWFVIKVLQIAVIWSRHERIWKQGWGAAPLALDCRIRTTLVTFTFLFIIAYSLHQLAHRTIWLWWKDRLMKIADFAVNAVIACDAGEFKMPAKCDIDLWNWELFLLFHRTYGSNLESKTMISTNQRIDGWANETQITLLLLVFLRILIL
jgi:hypothetical protein